MKRYKIELWLAICTGFPRLLEPVPSSVTNTRLASIIHVAHSTGKVKKRNLCRAPWQLCRFFLAVMFSLYHLYLQTVSLSLLHQNASSGIHCFCFPLSSSLYCTTPARGQTVAPNIRCSNIQM